jgi:hypothetical protein
MRGLLVVRTVDHDESQRDPTRGRGVPAFFVWRTRVVAALLWSDPPPLIPDHRDALPKGTVQPVVQLKVAAPHNDVVHDFLHIGREPGALRARRRELA